MNSQRVKIAIVAGEASGDILGAGLLQALKSHFPSMDVEGIGGDLMLAQGLHSLYPMERLSVMGLTEVLGRLPELLKLRKRLAEHWKQNPPDVFIGIDAPDFTLGLEEQLKAAGIATVHYVSPSVWAWRKKRIFKIKRSTDLMLTLLPFEAAFYEEHQQRVAFVGHPLADDIPLVPDVQTAKSQLNIASSKRVVALLPGSRKSEVSQLARVFLQTAQALNKHDPDLVFLLPAANQKRYQELKTLIAEEFAELDVQLLLKQSQIAMEASDAILIASGTATLEAMLYKKPMVVAYRMSSLTYCILSRMITSQWVSLPNLLAQQTLIPELLQQKATPALMTEALLNALDNTGYRESLVDRFTEIHLRLRQGASEKAADAVLSLMHDKGLMPADLEVHNV